MLKNLYLPVLICLFTTAAFAQDETPKEEEAPPKPLFGDKKIRPAWMDHLRYGGNGWLQFWNGFNVDLSPMVGYELNASGKTVVGTGVSLGYNGTFKNGIASYGTRVFLRQSIFRGIFAHAEYELMNAPASSFYGYTVPTSGVQTGRAWGTTPYIGLGLYRGGGRTKGSFVSVLINPLYPNKGYRSPFSYGGSESPLTIRIGFF